MENIVPHRQDRHDRAVPLSPHSASTLDVWLAQQPQGVRAWAGNSGFTAAPGSVCLMPGSGGTLERVLLGVGEHHAFWDLGAASRSLPEGDYRLHSGSVALAPDLAALAWGMGAYRFSRYSSFPEPGARLVLGPGVDAGRVALQLEGVRLVRDLINTPASDMSPRALASVAEDLADHFGGSFAEVAGEELLRRNFPLIHAVGRASVHDPRLLELCWGDSGPEVVLVGKGICFDSGGLDLKTSSSMRLMKKDMGGAAQALGLARMVMSAALPVRLRVVIAAAENAVSGDALRPGDVLTARNGRTVEIDNTDAEGRLVLADALVKATEGGPDLVLDFATLTGAARIAVGTEVAAIFTDDDAFAADLSALGEALGDPVWRLPLHRPYRYLLDSDIADIKNAASEPYAGAVSAALFLREFVPPECPWVHFDFMGWNLRDRPGRPRGGEAMGLRTAFAFLQGRYGGA